MDSMVLDHWKYLSYSYLLIVRMETAKQVKLQALDDRNTHITTIR